MDYKALMTSRYEEELKVIELLKTVDIQFENLLIETNTLVHWSTLAESVYKEIDLFKHFDNFHWNPVFYYFEIIKATIK